jgi:ubiquinone biosynthesis protein
MRERINPLQLLRNLQLQAEQVPHLSQIARDTLERLSLPAAAAASKPAATPASWPERLLGVALIAGGILQQPALLLSSWPAGLMIAGGLYLVLRR